MPKMRLEYVGPPEILQRSLATPSPTRRLIECPQDVADWARQTQQHLDSGREVTATFVVDTGERLWIADRCSEHVACAQSPQVLAAGEMTFYVEEEWAEVVGTSNQSTGFCPPPASWRDVEAALNVARLKHPGGWTSEFEFRRCDTCGTTNIVKDSWFWCEACGAQLSAEWNYG